MKTRVFTFILLVSMMISYSSCSSDDPILNLEEEEQVDDNTNSDNSSSNNIKLNSDSIISVIGLSTFINIDKDQAEHKQDKLEIYGYTQVGEKRIKLSTLTITSQGIELNTKLAVRSFSNGYSNGYEIYLIGGNGGSPTFFLYEDEDTLIGKDAIAKGTWKRIK